jgi:hypothetical protein
MHASGRFSPRWIMPMQSSIAGGAKAVNLTEKEQTR